MARCRRALGAWRWRFWHLAGLPHRALTALDDHLAAWHVPASTASPDLTCDALCGGAVCQPCAMYPCASAQPPLHLLATRAHLLGQLGRWPDARHALQQLHALDTRHAAHAFNLGFVCMQLGDAAAAAPAFRACLHSAPHMDQAWFGLGQALHALGDWSGAEAAWVKQVGMQPLCPDGYTQLVKLCVQRQDTQAARVWLNSLRAFDPRQALALEPHVAQACAQVAQLDARAGA